MRVQRQAIEVTILRHPASAYHRVTADMPSEQRETIRCALTKMPLMSGEKVYSVSRP